MKTKKLEGKAAELAEIIKDRMQPLQSEIGEIRAVRDEKVAQITPIQLEIDELGDQIRKKAPELGVFKNMLAALHTKQNEKLIPGQQHINEVVAKALGVDI